MRRGLLVIDRGSREPEAREELESLCAMARERGGYDAAGYCFLEVLPPFVPEGVRRMLDAGLDTLTIVPYFLYRGRKVKAAVAEAMRLQAGQRARFLVTRPMSMDPVVVELARDRVRAALEAAGSPAPESEADVLVIGHGSVDPNARMAMRYLVDGLAPSYRRVEHCYLELEQPDIRAGVAACERGAAPVLVVLFYFLHRGAHVKRDVGEELRPALDGARLGRVLLTGHIGADPKVADALVRLAREVEGRG